MDIHRCRFVPYNPHAINALAFSHPPSQDLPGRGVKTLRLAVGRANGDIEIWNPLRGAWFQETVLRGGKDRSIEGITWTLDPTEDHHDGDGAKLPGRLRLFSIGYSNVVTEWDLENGRAARHSSGDYGEIWCLAAQPLWKSVKGKNGRASPSAGGDLPGQLLAVGCADGSIVILSTADNDLKFLRVMRPSTKRSRVLSITFQDRDVIAAGYADSSIRVFCVRSGRVLRTISLGRGPIGGPKEILVWSIKCLPDGSFVSGDSTGEIRFWDAKNYSLIQRLQGHQADVLDVAVSADGESVVSGGADRRTVVYRLREGKKGDKRRRWAEVMHRRYHTHDVKAFAVYETKDISIVVSGGPDAAPVVLPLREFGRENHRKLPSLPQTPQLVSAPCCRLVMSFWDREIRIWRILTSPGSLYDNFDGQRYQLVGKVLIQGEENITSAALSPDGKLLAVATITDIKIFYLRWQKREEKEILRVQRLNAPREISGGGARLVCMSPDGRWLCIVRPNSDVWLAKIISISTQEKPRILPDICRANRTPRSTQHEKASHGTLGNFKRTIRSAVFSEDSRILASGDLSGYVDVWILEDVKNVNSKHMVKTTNGALSSEEESPDEDEQPVIEGQRWRASPTPIPRQGAGIIFMLFRPRKQAHSKALMNGVNHSSDKLSEWSDQLMIVTSEHQLVEYETRKGERSDWSKRNSKGYFPGEFTGIKDRAMGGLWDNDRLWLYGPSWLWMFDLRQDFPPPDSATISGEGKTDAKSSGELLQAPVPRKRKREWEHEEGAERKSNTGAGDSIPLSQVDISLRTKLRRIVGSDESKGEWISLKRVLPGGREGGEEDEDEREDGLLETNDLNLARLRREHRVIDQIDGFSGHPIDKVERNVSPLTNGKEKSSLVVVDHTDTRPLEKPVHDRSTSPEQQLREVKNGTTLQPPRRWWHTYKYRDILGVMPLSQQLDKNAYKDDTENRSGPHLEVAIVERPTWDMDLPGHYIKDHEGM